MALKLRVKGIAAAAAFGGFILMAAPTSAAAAAPGGPGPVPGPATDISQSCSGQNAEVEQAVDPARGYVYEDWIGCGGIGFGRSADGGQHFSAPITVPGSAGGTWDPAVAVAPDGTVYAAYMITKGNYTYPVVAASFDHGQSFPQVSPLGAPVKKNWGDRDFIAVGPDGSVYVTWDYGPSAADVTDICTAGGSCAFATGDLNVVIQKSTDGGKTWSKIIPVSPGFPASGGDSAPLLVEPNGRIDLEYQGYHITNSTTYTMTPAHSYFTSSDDGGKTWSAPVQIGPDNLTMSLAEWWIDGDIARDAAGNLYITWDTQVNGQDVGWLSYSADGGKTWSPLQRVTPDTGNATHIVEVSGGPPGVAYVGWLADNSPSGYAEYLRPFSIVRGWLSGPVQVSSQFGNDSVWPGDTFGISTLPSGPQPGLGSLQRVLLSWGSAIGQPDSEIYAATVSYEGGLG